MQNLSIDLRQKLTLVTKSSITINLGLMVNKVILLGNLGNDPLVRNLENGTPIATFSMATSETYKDREGNKQSKTEWHRIVLWRGLAEIAGKFLRKGDRIYLEGKLSTRTYEQDGTTKYVTEIVGETLTILSPPRNASNGNGVPLPTEEPAHIRTKGSTEFHTQPAAEADNFNKPEEPSNNDLPF